MTKQPSHWKKPNLNPGGDEAIAKGCICPVLDNRHGDEALGRTRGFWISSGCPLHDKTEKKDAQATALPKEDKEQA